MRPTSAPSSATGASENFCCTPQPAGVLTLLLFIPCFNLNSGLYGDYPPLNKGGLQILHEQFVAEGNTPGLLQGIQVYQDSSEYVLVSLCCSWTAASALSISLVHM